MLRHYLLLRQYPNLVENVHHEDIENVTQNQNLRFPEYTVQLEKSDIKVIFSVHIINSYTMGNTVSDAPFNLPQLDSEYNDCLDQKKCNEKYFKEHCKQTCKDRIKPSARRAPTRRRLYNKIFLSPFIRGGRQTRKKYQTRRNKLK